MGYLLMALLVIVSTIVNLGIAFLLYKPLIEAIRESYTVKFPRWMAVIGIIPPLAIVASVIILIVALICLPFLHED